MLSQRIYKLFGVIHFEGQCFNFKSQIRTHLCTAIGCGKTHLKHSSLEGGHNFFEEQPVIGDDDGADSLLKSTGFRASGANIAKRRRAC